MVRVAFFFRVAFILKKNDLESQAVTGMQGQLDSFCFGAYQELQQAGNECLRIFLRNPVRSVWNTETVDVVRHFPHHLLNSGPRVADRTEYSQNRNCEFSIPLEGVAIEKRRSPLQLAHTIILG